MSFRRLLKEYSGSRDPHAWRRECPGACARSHNVADSMVGVVTVVSAAPEPQRRTNDDEA
jgi:hypothetical protein